MGSDFNLIVKAAHLKYGNTIKFIVIGKNLGGSVAAYSINEFVDCLIVTGSVPILSKFWVSSSHPIAIASRKNLSKTTLEEFEMKTSEFDLIQSIQNLNTKKILIQFGTNDPWIEKESVQLLESKIKNNTLIQWVEDDHAMASTITAGLRKSFLLNESNLWN